MRTLLRIVHWISEHMPTHGDGPTFHERVVHDRWIASHRPAMPGDGDVTTDNDHVWVRGRV